MLSSKSHAEAAQAVALPPPGAQHGVQSRGRGKGSQEQLWARSILPGELFPMVWACLAAQGKGVAARGLQRLPRDQAPAEGAFPQPRQRHSALSCRQPPLLRAPSSAQIPLLTSLFARV